MRDIGHKQYLLEGAAMKFFAIFSAAIILFVSGCATPSKNTAYQTSTIDALLAGVYDGETSCAELLKHGNLGIGTFDGIDGEMVVLDGEVYQVKSDGRVYRPKPSMMTPFATVCRFTPDTSVNIPAGSDYNALKKTVDNLAPNQNLFYAIKITGKFKAMKTRSVPGQHKPYPPLKQVTANQPEFSMSNISGTIVGFRCPPYVKGINVPGYHLHFLSSDKTQGGHILSFEVDSAECEIDELNRYFLTLPHGSSDFADTDLAKDRADDLKKVEQ
jgi:acetolactate decarboxylase